MLRRAVPLLRRVQQRSLGSWAARFEAARGADLETRKALAAELADVWKIEKDEAEAQQMEAEADAPPGSQTTYVLSVEDTAVGILRAALMPDGQSGHTGLLIGAQVDPALSLACAGAPLIAAAREGLQQRSVDRVIAVAPIAGLCSWIVDEKAWEKVAVGLEPTQPQALTSLPTSPA